MQVRTFIGRDNLHGIAVIEAETACNEWLLKNKCAYFKNSISIDTTTVFGRDFSIEINKTFTWYIHTITVLYEPREE